MSELPPYKQPPARRNLVGIILQSKIGGVVANFPPIKWIVRKITRRVVRKQIGGQVRHGPEGSVEYTVHGDSQATHGQNGSSKRIARADLDSTLDSIVHDVVEALGYIAAMVATYEPDDSLRNRAFLVDPRIASKDQIYAWEALVSQSTGLALSLTDPMIARVYVYEPRYQKNLSVQAWNARSPVRSKALFDLFRPVVPDAASGVIDGIQEELGIREVIAVPFFLETIIDGQVKQELVGDLFALKNDLISARDEAVLSAFGRQAAVAILSERRESQVQAIQNLIFNIQAGLRSEEQILNQIVERLVADLHYVAAMVATYEPDDALPIRAFAFDPALASRERLHEWEQIVSRGTGLDLSLTNPEIAKVYVHERQYEDNLSVKAYKARSPVRSKALFDLLQPVVPNAVSGVIEGIQEEMGVREVIAVPFFIDEILVGNLFALTRSNEFSSGEIELLRAFGQQAAVGLRNARLYREVEEQHRIAEEQRRIAEERRQQAEEQRRLAEERRQAAEIFGKMAFNAATNVHDLRGLVGKVRLALDNLFSDLEQAQLSEAQNGKVAQRKQRIVDRLGQISNTLGHLHEPWKISTDKPTDINDCIVSAIRKADLAEQNWIHLSLADDLPNIKTSPAMLSEAFKVLIKNASEALEKKGQDRALEIVSQLTGNGSIEVTVQDNGIGIKPEHLTKIFEMRWTTKREGLGFGLFWAKDYIEGLKGIVKVESELDHGTTFRVTIPVIGEPQATTTITR